MVYLFSKKEQEFLSKGEAAENEVGKIKTTLLSNTSSHPQTSRHHRIRLRSWHTSTPTLSVKLSHVRTDQSLNQPDLNRVAASLLSRS